MIGKGGICMGRKAKFVKGPDGKEIYGLSYSAAVRCHYATFSKPRKYFKKDLAGSLFEFFKWQGKGESRRTVMFIPADFEGTEPPKGGFVDWKSCPDPVVQETYPGENLCIPETLFLEKARNLILTDAIVAAKKLGIPELAHLPDLPKPEKPLTLRQVGQFYYEHRNPSHDELRKCQTTWRGFCKVVRVKEVRELKVEHIQEYKDVMIARQKKHRYSKYWLRGKFNRVKTLFNHSFEQGTRNLEALKRVIDLCKRLKAVSGSDNSEPKPISREHFHRLLDQADIKWRAMLLLGLNCGYYAKDIHDLKKHMIHNRNGLDYIVFPREKTKHMRVNVLWQITKEALDVYMKQYPNDLEYVFTTANGKQIHPHEIQRGLDRRRKKLGVPDSVKFSHLRDGAATAMFGKVSGEMLNIIIGHRIKGEKKKYIQLKPEQVKPCADMIYEEYFGEEKTWDYGKVIEIPKTKVG